MRPADEVCRLRWESVEINGDDGRIRIGDVKTTAGHRVIPLKAAVYEHFGIPNPVVILWNRHEARGRPTRGWVFPTRSRRVHLTEGTDKLWRAKALENLAEVDSTP